MKKSDKRLLLWITLAVGLLLGAVVLFQRSPKYIYHLPVVVAEPKLVASGGYASPFVGYVFVNYKVDGEPSTSKDSIGMRISYTNVGSKGASDVKRSVITVLRKNNKLEVHSVDTLSSGTPRPALPGVYMSDQFYLPNFLPADTQFIYMKINYYSKAGVLAGSLREMLTYNHDLLDRHLPATDDSTYASVKNLLVSKHLW